MVRAEERRESEEGEVDGRESSVSIWRIMRGTMHLSGVAVLTVRLCFHLLSPSLSIRLHVEHANRFARSQSKHAHSKGANEPSSDYT